MEHTHRKEECYYERRVIILINRNVCPRPITIIKEQVRSLSLSTLLPSLYLIDMYLANSPLINSSLPEILAAKTTTITTPLFSALSFSLLMPRYRFSPSPPLSGGNIYFKNYNYHHHQIPIKLSILSTPLSQICITTLSALLYHHPISRILSPPN